MSDEVDGCQTFGIDGLLELPGVRCVGLRAGDDDVGPPLAVPGELAAGGQ